MKSYERFPRKLQTNEWGKLIEPTSEISGSKDKRTLYLSHWNTELPQGISSRLETQRISFLAFQSCLFLIRAATVWTWPWFVLGRPWYYHSQIANAKLVEACESDTKGDGRKIVFRAPHEAPNNYPSWTLQVHLYPRTHLCRHTERNRTTIKEGGHRSKEGGHR